MSWWGGESKFWRCGGQVSMVGDLPPYWTTLVPYTHHNTTTIVWSTSMAISSLGHLRQVFNMALLQYIKLKHFGQEIIGGERTPTVFHIRKLPLPYPTCRLYLSTNFILSKPPVLMMESLSAIAQAYLYMLYYNTILQGLGLVQANTAKLWPPQVVHVNRLSQFTHS